MLWREQRDGLIVRVATYLLAGFVTFDQSYRNPSDIFVTSRAFFFKKMYEKYCSQLVRTRKRMDCTDRNTVGRIDRKMLRVKKRMKTYLAERNER